MVLDEEKRMHAFAVNRLIMKLKRVGRLAQ
jgi:hypothetical protein